MPLSAYPIRPKPDGDLRFTNGLVIDVSRVLEQHGYPPVTDGADFVRLSQRLFHFLYGDES